MTTFDNATPAQRIKRPGWRDARFVIGLLLVVISIALTVWVIRSADSRTGYWATAEDATPGTQLSSDDFVVVEANLAESADHYWPADKELPESFAVTSTLHKGQILPTDAVDDTGEDKRQQLAIEVDDRMPKGLTVGQRVDLWVSEPTESGRGFESAFVGAQYVELTEIQENTATFGSTHGHTVHILVEPSEVPVVLNAQVNGSQMHLVPSVGGEREPLPASSPEMQPDEDIEAAEVQESEES